MTTIIPPTQAQKFPLDGVPEFVGAGDLSMTSRKTESAWLSGLGFMVLPGLLLELGGEDGPTPGDGRVGVIDVDGALVVEAEGDLAAVVLGADWREGVGDAEGVEEEVEVGGADPVGVDEGVIVVLGVDDLEVVPDCDDGWVDEEGGGLVIVVKRFTSLQGLVQSVFKALTFQ